LRDFLQGTLGLGAAWKLALGLVFVLLVTFLRRGVISGLVDVATLAGWRSGGAEGAGSDARKPRTSGRMRPFDAVSSSSDGGNPILQTHGVSKRYGGLYANKEINFSLRRGELRGIIGPNGAGKSTFFKMLTCEVAPSSGRIVFDGQDITGFGVTAVCQLGLTKSYQINQLFTRLSVRENVVIAVLARLQGPMRYDLLHDTERFPGLVDEVDELLALVRLADRAQFSVSQLAYGEKRRLEIGLALAAKPRLFLLDEPLAGMSPSERVETVRLLKSIQKGRTLVVIDHDMDAIFELAERITVLSEGSILTEGTPEEIKANRNVQDAYLGGVHEI
jgi:branched-chain amino acid transport system permease protein